MPEQFFVRRGKKYIPINPTDGWIGFPCDGIWLVQHDFRKKAASCILRLGELPELYPFAQMAVKRDELASCIRRTMDEAIKERGGYSAQELADEVLKFLSIQVIRSPSKKHGTIMGHGDTMVDDPRVPG